MKLEAMVVQAAEATAGGKEKEVIAGAIPFSGHARIARCRLDTLELRHSL